jgi:superfamily II DNA or RNA helicase
MPLEQRPYQSRIVGKTLQAFERGLISVLIESPCGSGKTVMALEAARQMEKQGYKIGWVSLRRNLLKQAAAMNEEFFGIKNIQWISLFQNEVPPCDFLILDECHHQACGSCVSLLNQIKPKKFLGMSATPFRTDRMQLSFQKVIKDAGIHVLIQQGYLAPYQHFVMPEYNPVTVSEFYLREKEKWGKTLAYFLSVDECYQMKNLLWEAGVKSEVVTADTDRDAQLEMFEKGEIPVLINVFILTEGFDCPSLKTVFVRPSGRGPSIQMGGRVFRKHPSKEYAQIVQCKQTRFAFPHKVKALAEWVWVQGSEEGQWRSVVGNENVALAQATSLRIIANSASVKLPQMIQKSLSSRRRRNRGESLGGWLSSQ